MLKKLDKANQESNEVARQLQEERLKIDTKLNTKEHEIREWTLKNLEENYIDYDRLMNAKLLEQENKVK